jgi:hypothetical protein
MVKYYINMKFEIRSTKQYRMTKIQMTKMRLVSLQFFDFVLIFGNLSFEFVSNFDIRYSDF